MSTFYTLLLVVIGFALLVKGADLLVEGASSTAKRMNLSELVIGLTIVAIGTSAPELIVNVLSTLKDHNDVVFGNIIGSNIFNTFVILGIAGLIYPMSVKHNTVWREIPISLLITIVFLVLVNDQWFYDAASNQVNRMDGLILILLFTAFLFYIFKYLKKEIQDETEDFKVLSKKNTFFYLMGGITGISIGGHMVVENAVATAHIFNVSERLIGLTIISAGTSLPELATSVVAALKKKSDIAIGNVIGSNVFNITLVLGSTALINPVSYDTILNFDLSVLIAGTVLLFIFMFTLTVRKLDRWEAFILVIIAVAYITFLVIRK